MERTVTISGAIRREIAERAIQQANDTAGAWYVVDGCSVQYAQRTTHWNPWRGRADAIRVDDLIYIYGGADHGHDLTVEYALRHIPDSYEA